MENVLGLVGCGVIDALFGDFVKNNIEPTVKLRLRINPFLPAIIILFETCLISLPSPDDDIDDEAPPISSSSLEKMPKPNDSPSAQEDLEKTAVEQLVEELKVKTENRIHVS